MRRFFSRSVLVLICTVPPVTAGSLNSLQIVQSALSPSCMEYKITGMCYWLFCTLYGCTVKTFVKVRHYIPDAVVSAYNQTGRNP
ncbi:TIGR03756 family integrating conjugative element protein, partial [Salmonella enterica subsp. enterica]|nr:TIGR03756 family integrating conjugative element protein [Salmonella enterica subsp. enterica serovar Typhimurium]